jgi:hypothetical protein
MDVLESLKRIERWYTMEPSFRGYSIKGGVNDGEDDWTVSIWSKKPDGSYRSCYPITMTSYCLAEAVELCFRERYHQVKLLRESGKDV